jgi:adenine-specific DNA-methyltransferase
VSASGTEQLANADFMEYSAEPVDLVIGNPPYFVVTTKEPAAMKGRGNMFVLFIYKCLTKHMIDGSVLAFVLPTSFYNCSYYEPCRKYIKDNTTVLHLESIDANFYETAQDTMLMILRKGSSTQNPYVLERGGGVYLTPFAPEIRRLIEATTTLKSLGFSVKTGEVVWNQEKDKLSDSGTPLIYASNIVGNEIRLGPMKGGKKQYIQGFGTPIKGPAILIPRGYGNKYKFAWTTVADGFEFHGENHVNVITGPAASMPRVKASLANPKTLEFIRMFVGNGALSKTEIECVLPIF